MRENRTSGSMSGRRKRSINDRLLSPRRRSTLPRLLLRTTKGSDLSGLSRLDLLGAVLLRLRRPNREKPNISLPFAALATNPGEKVGL
jgi:hypothetical protein